MSKFRASSNNIVAEMYTLFKPVKWYIMIISLYLIYFYKLKYKILNYMQYVKKLFKESM